MAFFIRKLVEAALLPVGFCGLLILAGILTRRRKAALAGVALLWIASMPVTGDSLSSPLDHYYPRLTVAESPHADAVVVLGGYIIRAVSPLGIQWATESSRFFVGIDLKTAGKAPWLVLPGSQSGDGAVPDFGALLREEAVRRGVPADQIRLGGQVFTTEDEARAVARLPGIRRVILVTSGFHEPRAALLFRAAGLDVIPFPSDPGPVHLIQSVDWIPTGNGIANTDFPLREYYGLAVYKLLLAFRHP